MALVIDAPRPRRRVAVCSRDDGRCPRLQAGGGNTRRSYHLVRLAHPYHRRPRAFAHPALHARTDGNRKARRPLFAESRSKGLAARTAPSTPFRASALRAGAIETATLQPAGRLAAGTSAGPRRHPMAALQARACAERAPRPRERPRLGRVRRVRPAAFARSALRVPGRRSRASAACSSSSLREDDFPIGVQGHGLGLHRNFCSAEHGDSERLRDERARARVRIARGGGRNEARRARRARDRASPPTGRRVGRRDVPGLDETRLGDGMDPMKIFERPARA